MATSVSPPGTETRRNDEECATYWDYVPSEPLEIRIRNARSEAIFLAPFKDSAHFYACGEPSAMFELFRGGEPVQLERSTTCGAATPGCFEVQADHRKQPRDGEAPPCPGAACLPTWLRLGPGEEYVTSIDSEFVNQTMPAACLARRPPTEPPYAGETFECVQRRLLAPSGYTARAGASSTLGDSCTLATESDSASCQLVASGPPAPEFFAEATLSPGQRTLTINFESPSDAGAPARDAGAPAVDAAVSTPADSAANAGE